MLLSRVDDGGGGERSGERSFLTTGQSQRLKVFSIPPIWDMQEPKADGATLVEPEDSAVIARSALVLLLSVMVVAVVLQW